MIEYIKHLDLLLAIIIKHDFKEEGIKFFTPDDFSQQLGYMNRPKGYVIQPHVHNAVDRTVTFTQEVLFVKSGLVKIQFYTPEKEYLFDRILEAGDVILLSSGGHGFEMLEPTEMIEVKQGPYSGEHDKTRF